MNKRTELARIAKEIEQCATCKKGKIGRAVPGEGSPYAKVMFLGEAPGKEESVAGRPFIGRSGKLLRRLISEIGLEEKSVFITSPVKYLPSYVTPTPADIVHGVSHWSKQLNVISPRVLVLLGNTACRAVLQRPSKILSEHGTVMRENGRVTFLTLHPAAAIRFQKFKEPLVKDFRKLQRLLLKEGILE